MVQCTLPVYSVRQENIRVSSYEIKLIFELICMTNAENEKQKSDCVDKVRPGNKPYALA